MKKKLLLLFLPMLLLTGCNKSSGGVIPEKERETVTLTKDNYFKYIAVYTYSDTYSNSGTYTFYHYHLVGSSLCKFIDCKITYAFSSDNGALEENYKSYEINLTLSGCGESVESTRRLGYSYYYHFTVLSASGTVEILY